MRAGGSRELPSVLQLYDTGVNESKDKGECIALKHFREPLALIFFSATSVEANIARAAGHEPKRLPSRGAGRFGLAPVSGGDVSQKIIEYLGGERLVVGIAADQVPLIKAFVDRIVGNTFTIA